MPSKILEMDRGVSRSWLDEVDVREKRSQDILFFVRRDWVEDPRQVNLDLDDVEVVPILRRGVLISWSYLNPCEQGKKTCLT